MRENQLKIILISLWFLCMFMILSGLWAIDIGVSGMVYHARGFETWVTNGIWSRSPLLQYHIGLWLIGIASFVFSITCIYAIFKKDL